MADETLTTLPLTGGAQDLIASAREQCQANHSKEVTSAHWLLALLERNGAMAAALVDNLDVKAAREQAQKRLQAGAADAPLSEPELLAEAKEEAQRRSKNQISERDLAVAILRRSGFTVKAEEPWKPARVQPAPDPAPAGSISAATSGQGATPALDMFGRDFTRAAQTGKLGQVLHRDEIIEQVLETLCRRTKRNPVLVGPAGVGKTAIVEGVALRIANGAVPAPLRGVRLIGIQPSTLVAGSSMMGEMEKRVKEIIAEASQPGIVLFIDELHSIIGAGGSRGATDMASLLKPVLARGEIACIGATTDDEYRRFIEEDKALERRFNRIAVEELTADQTLAVLSELRNMYAKDHHIEIEDRVLVQLVRFGDRYMKNRRFPDKAVDLLEQCVARAVAKGKSNVDATMANEVGERVVGMPAATEDHLADLCEQLALTQLTEADSKALADRLQVTLRALDVAAPRPNAVVLLAGQAGEQAGDLAAMIAQCLFGNATRIVVIDFGQFVNDEDITRLLGSAPGYVGYDDALPIHRVAQTPWCVLICQNIDLCHPVLRSVLRQALASGYFTDGKGRRVFLSDAVVLLTCSYRGSENGKAKLGFALGPNETGHADKSHSAHDGQLEDALGAEFMAQVDLVVTQLAQSHEGLRRNLETLLDDVSKRYAQHNLDIAWQSAAINCILDHGRANWEKFIDLSISPLLVGYLADAEGKERVHVRVDFVGDEITVESVA